jgi:carbon storage regulator
VLVLSRKAGERIMLGDDIQVTVLSIHGRHVKLGISGPADVPIHRAEVYRRIQCGSGVGMNVPPLVPRARQLVPPFMPLGECGRTVDTI